MNYFKLQNQPKKNEIQSFSFQCTCSSLRFETNGGCIDGSLHLLDISYQYKQSSMGWLIKSQFLYSNYTLSHYLLAKLHLLKKKKKLQSCYSLINLIEPSFSSVLGLSEPWIRGIVWQSNHRHARHKRKQRFD